MTHMLGDEVAAARARLGWHNAGAASPDRRYAVIGFDSTASSAAALAYAGGWAERNHGAVVVVHVDAAAGATMAECACAMAGVVTPDIPARDLSADVDEAMEHISACWACLNVRGDVPDQLERVARALEADVIVVGRPARPRLRIAHSVGRRLLATTRHIIVVV